MDLNTTKNELDLAEKNMQPYQDPNLMTTVKNQVMDQWTPILKSSVNAAQGMMADYLPKFMGMAGTLGGTSEADMSPTQKMGYMGTQLGQMSGNLYNATALSDYFGGKASEMAKNAQTALQYGQTQMAQAYDRAFQRYQLAFQAAESEKARQASIRAAQIAASTYSGGGGGGGGGGGTNNVTSLSQINTDKMNSTQLKDLLNSGTITDPNVKSQLMQLIGGRMWTEKSGGVTGTTKATSNVASPTPTVSPTKTVLPSYNGKYGLF